MRPGGPVDSSPAQATVGLVIHAERADGRLDPMTVLTTEAGGTQGPGSPTPTLDPLASSVPVELDLPVPTWRKAGGGHQAIYRGVTVEQAWRVIEALEDRANATSRYDDRHRATGRALRDTASRLRRQLGAAVLVEAGSQQE